MSVSTTKATSTTQAGGCWAADQSLTEIYLAEYDSLVRMAASLVSDIETAEDVVQDSIVAMHGAWPNLYDSEKALAYVRQSVMNRARSVIRRRMVVDRHPPKPEPERAERRVQRPHGTGTIRGCLGAATAPAEAAGSSRAEVLPWPSRRPDCLHDGDHQGHCKGPHPPGHDGHA